MKINAGPGGFDKKTFKIWTQYQSVSLNKIELQPSDICVIVMLIFNDEAKQTVLQNAAISYS